LFIVCRRDDRATELDFPIRRMSWSISGTKRQKKTGFHVQSWRQISVLRDGDLYSEVWDSVSMPASSAKSLGADRPWRVCPKRQKLPGKWARNVLQLRKALTDWPALALYIDPQ